MREAASPNLRSNSSSSTSLPSWPSPSHPSHPGPTRPQGPVTPTTIRSILRTKAAKSEQKCISPNDRLTPRAKPGRFIKLSADHMRRAAADASRNANCTGTISLHHLDRIQDTPNEALARQRRTVKLKANGRTGRKPHRVPISPATGPVPDLRLMRDEVSGPPLPVAPHEDVDGAVATINAKKRPPGPNVFGNDPAVTSRVFIQVVSGGAAVDPCAIQDALPSLAFGDAGMLPTALRSNP